MAHFAKLDEAGTVLEVHCVHNNELLDENGNESEQKGIDFLINWSGGHPFWKQTSYNGNFRKNFAGPGFVYDEEKDAFIPPKPFLSWVFNSQLCIWEPPIPLPEDGIYSWNEQNACWDEVILDD